MAVSNQPVLVQTPQLGVASFVNADGTTKKTIATAGSDGSKVVAVSVSSTDTGTRILQLWLTRSATSYLLVSLLIAIAAGSDGSVAVANMLNTTIWPALPIDNDGQVYLFLKSGDTLQASVTVAVTAAKEIDVTAIYGNF